MKASAFFTSILGSSQDPFRPEFKIFADGSITPQIGSDDTTFTRSGTTHYWTSPSTVAVAADGAPEENVFPSDLLAPTTARKGVLLHGVNRNEALETNSFDQWDLIGTPTVTANASTAPDGSSTADRLQADADEGLEIVVTQDSTTFAGAKMTVACAIKAASGTPTIKLRIKDEGGNYGTAESHPNGFVVSNEWRLYECWSTSPVPGDGNYVVEITASGGAADVYLAFCNVQFSGQSDTWDHHSIGHIPSYKGTVTDTRLSTGKTTLTYTSPEIIGEISEYTVNMWVYMPDADTNWTPFEQSFFSAENEAGQVLMSLIWMSGTGVVIRLGTTTDIPITQLATRYMVRGRWAMFTFALKSGDSALYLDGQQIYSNNSAISAFTIDYFTPGSSNRDNVGLSHATFGWPMSGVEIWKERKDSTFISGLYNKQVSDDALPDDSTRLFPTAGAVDTIRFDSTSGNITSEVEALTLTPNGTIYYQVQAARAMNNGSSIKGARLQGTGGYFEIASLPVAYDIGALESFVVLSQFRFAKNDWSGGSKVLFDSSDDANAQGIVAYVSSNAVDFFACGAGGNHVSRYTWNPNVSLTDGKLYTFRWVFNRSNTSADFYYKAEGETEQGPFTTSVIINDFNAIGAISHSGTNMRFGSVSNGTSNFSANMYQWAFAKGTTYDATAKP